MTPESPQARPSGSAQRFEPWAWLAFALGALGLGLFVALGSRPGGTLGIWLYLRGTAWLFLGSGLLLAFALVWAVLHRPILARRRLVPLLVLGLCVWGSSLPFPYPSSHEGHWSTVDFRLPFEGSWRVLWGGERRSQNALVFSPARRFGFEFLPLERATPPPVLAPCDGRVAGLEGARPDGAAERTPFGNHVVLEVAPEAYLVLANLRAGSLTVRIGERVLAGDVLGALGDSSAASWRDAPQLMVHLQDAPEPGRGEGIPMRFGGYETVGGGAADGVPRGGMGRQGPSGEVVRPAGPR